MSIMEIAVPSSPAVKLTRKNTIILPTLYYPVYDAARLRYLTYLGKLSEVADIELIVKHLGGDNVSPIEYLMSVAGEDAILLSALIDSSASLMRNVLWTINQTFKLTATGCHESSELEDEMNNLMSLLWDIPNLKGSAAPMFNDAPLTVTLAEDGTISLCANQEVQVIRGRPHLNGLEVNIKTLTGLSVDFVDEYDWMCYRSIRNTGTDGRSIMLIGSRRYYRTANGDNNPEAEPTGLVVIPKGTVIANLTVLDPLEAF